MATGAARMTLAGPVGTPPPAPRSGRARPGPGFAARTGGGRPTGTALPAPAVLGRWARSASASVRFGAHLRSASGCGGVEHRTRLLDPPRGAAPAAGARPALGRRPP